LLKRFLKYQPKRQEKKLERTQQFEIEEVFRETSVYHDGLQYFS